MKNFFTLMTVLIALSVVFSGGLQAQRSVSGIPQSSLYEDLTEIVDFREFEAPDMVKIHAEDEVKQSPYRVGVAVPVNLDINNSGTWTTLPDGGKIWRLTIKVEGALALGVYYDNFWLPYGGELYVYNEEKDHIVGAYTELNNNSDCVFANTMVVGDVITLEYYQPVEQTIEPMISISEVSYNYRGVNINADPDTKSSSWCMININCSPEGDNWQDEKKGVVKQYQKIGYFYYLCSGSLINNTEQDLKPYVLSAWHCADGASATDLNQWIFYFNYEATTCAGNYGSQSQSMTGCWKRAEGSYLTGSDFLLLELKYDVPAGYNAYFNGWDRRNVGADSGVSIHHPAGDIKKISTYNTTLTSSQWNNNGVLSHWKVWWQETPHGKSITEGGSSGSPLFSQDSHIVGDLGGGPPDDCYNPSYSLYGKVYHSWDKMGTQNSQRLKPWLDPGDYGPMTWDGTYSGEEPVASFSADVTTIPVGGQVDFEDHSTGNPLEWEWTFEGGSPGSYTGQSPPMITYDTPGRYDVTLEASNTIGSNTADSIEMIIVGAPETDFNVDEDYLASGETANFTDESNGSPTSWLWTFEGGTPETSTDQNPTDIQYDTQGQFDVTLEATNEYGSNTMVKDDFITVDGPFADFEADNTYIEPGQSVTFTDISLNNPDSWSWKFFGGSPGAYSGQEPPAVTYNSQGAFNVKLTVSNDMGNNAVTKVDYINVGNVRVDEETFDDMLNVYPNPAQGTFTLDVGPHGLGEVQLIIRDTRGEIVHQQVIEGRTEKINVDMSDQPAGIYLLSVQSGDIKVDRKLTLVK